MRDDGQLVTASLMDYCLPRADDLPSFAFETRNVPSTTNPLGLKGAGEAGSIGACAGGDECRRRCAPPRLRHRAYRHAGDAGADCGGDPRRQVRAAADSVPANATGPIDGERNMTTIYDFSAKALSGEEIPLSDFRGKVLLIVNTASKCGFTPQYSGLEKLHREFGPRGFAVLGFPCNQFGHQEPGDAEEIRKFCTLTYDVSFPLFAKIDVNGANAHPLYSF